MDRTLILDLSSDDEVTLDNTSNADNFDWITKLFEDAGGEIEDDNPISNGGLFNLGDVIGGQNKEKEKEKEEHDSDDVVVVGEVIVKKPRKSRNLVQKNSVDDDDDDCVVLEGDPDKPKDEVKDPEDDSDDLCIVSETGQVACRDYPHPRHLCAKFPFSSTAHDNRCDMCHCYVCDSVAPCPLWNSGDHCHATDKDEYWKQERRRMRQIQNSPCCMPVTKPIVNSLPQRLHLHHISTGPNQLLRPTNTGGVLPTFGFTNNIRNQRSGVAVASKRLQPHLVSRQTLKSCNSHSQVQGNRGASLSPRVVSSHPMFKRSGPTSRAVVSNRPTFRAPNNVGLPLLQLPHQRLNGNSAENNFVNSTTSSLHLNINTTFCQPSTSSVSPGTLSPQLQGYSQPISHTPSSQYHGYGHSAAVASNIPYTYTSMNQTQNVPGLTLPCNTNLQNSATLSSEQQSGVTQTISGPNVSCSIPPDDISSYTLRSNQTPLEQNHSSPILSCSTSSAMKSLSVSCQPSSAAENSLVQGGVPMHELLPSIEQNAQQLGNTEQLDFDFENWFQDGEPILGSQDTSFLLELNNQASVPVPVDTGMLYFDFETSWQGLTHS